MCEVTRAHTHAHTKSLSLSLDLPLDLPLDLSLDLSLDLTHTFLHFLPGGLKVIDGSAAKGKNGNEALPRNGLSMQGQRKRDQTTQSNELH